MIDILEDDSTSGSPRSVIDQPGPQNLVVVDWAVASAQGTQRLRNEDNWGQLGPIFSVADGMGGLDDGDTASAVATRAVGSQWFANEQVNPVDVVRAINADVLAASDTGGGTTLSALRVAHDQVTIVHVGDSRIYRVREGQAEVLTRDHNLRTELLSAGIVPGSVHNIGPLRALTSYLGLPTEDLQIDVRSVALRAGDVLVLCTDGVFDGMSHRRFVEVTCGRPADSTDLIAQGLTDVGRPDDATAMVLKIGVAT